MSKPIAIIERNSKFFQFDWRTFFEYRDLLYLMVRKEIVSKYQQTFLGPLWYIFQPLLTASIFYFVFTKTLGVMTQGVPPLLFYFSGLLIWNYVSQTLSATSMALVANSGLFKRVYFPRVMVPLSQAVAFVFTLGFQSLIFLTIYFLYKFWTPWGMHLQANSYLLLIPFLLVQLVCLALGLGLWVSSLSVRFRDFHHLLGFGLTLWMYASPIAYPIEKVPSDWSFAVVLNPLVPGIQIVRQAFFGQGMVSVSHLGYSALMTLAILGSGFVYFHRIERTLIDKL